MTKNIKNALIKNIPIAIMLYLIIAFTAYYVEHPEMGRMEQIIHVWDAISFN